MCGFSGVLACGRHPDWPEILMAMGNTLTHRGPDDSGEWFDANSGIGLAHRRLSIIDLSSAGHQPMHSSSGRYVIVFNGEIYNHHELRLELDSLHTHFRGHSDTEVLLTAFETWGVEKTLKKVNGMFALALWDRGERQLILARDRIGEKPLYYGWQGKNFLFASELKAIRAHPEFHPVIDRDALALYLQFNYVPGPFSIYSGIRKLTPGTWVTVDYSQIGKIYGPFTYWSIDEAAHRGIENRYKGDQPAALLELDHILRDAVRLRMEADVPLGAFLSGGIDSSTIVALMQAQSLSRIRTFSIGFSDHAFNEATFAKSVAEHLGTEHTELYLSPNDALEVIPEIPNLYDEPIGDSSQIPTYLVAKLARKNVTVALSGDGGDELFGGYNRYFKGRSFWKRFGVIPSPLRGLVGSCLSSMLRPGVCSRISGLGHRLSGARPKSGTLCDKADKLKHLLGARNPDELYGELVYFWRNPHKILRHGTETPCILEHAGKALPSSLGIAERMMILDIKTYLPDNILTKVDRATMAISLEGRVPFLDHNVVEFVCRLPESWKLGASSGKLLLKQLLYKYLPQSLMERPKMGFSMPISNWLRNELRDWGEELLSYKRLEDDGIFAPMPIRHAWHDHISGKRNLQYKLWNILMFQAWYRKWLN